MIWPATPPVWGAIIGISFVSTFFHVIACLSIDNDSSLCFGGNVSFLYSFGLSAFILALFVVNCHFFLNRSKLSLKVMYSNLVFFFNVNSLTIIIEMWDHP